MTKKKDWFDQPQNLKSISVDISKKTLDIDDEVDDMAPAPNKIYKIKVS